jgi:hypothetical protein
MSRARAVCYCDDGSVAAAIIRRGPSGLSLYPASAILGHGQAEYAYPVGIPNAQEITCLNSFNGAWAHLRLNSEACLLKIDSGSGLPQITLYHEVDVHPDRAFQAQGISTGKYQRENLSIHL